MAVTNALAGVAVKELALAVAWYSRLLDRAPDTRPMEGLAEWSFPGGGWMQVFEDGGRAGRSSVTLVEDDLDARLADLAAKAIAVESASTSEMAKVAILRDPDGNLVVSQFEVDARLTRGSGAPAAMPHSDHAEGT